MTGTHNAPDDLRDSVALLLDTALSVAGEDASQAGRLRLTDNRTRLAEDTYHVVVCGEFSRGKTSLINALIGEPGLLPTGGDVTTRSITTIGWGEEFSATARRQGAEAEATPLTREQLQAHAGDDPDSHGETANLVEVAVPAAPLRHGLTLVDTPGIGSLNPLHTSITLSFLPRADAVVFVCSVLEPLTTLELEFLARAARHCPTVVIAATHTDRLYRLDGIAEEIRTRACQAMGVAPDQVRVALVSSTEREWELSQDPRSPGGESGFAELEALLWHGIAISCAATRLTAALDVAADVLHSASAPVVNELSGLTAESEQTAREQIEEFHHRARALRSQGADWRVMLRLRIDQAGEEIRRNAQDEVLRLEDEFAERVDNGEAARHPQRMLRWISTELVELADAVETKLGQRISAIAAETEAEVSIPLTLPGTQAISYTPDLSSAEEVLKRPTDLSWLRQGFSTGVAAGGYGATLGAFIATMFAPGVGTAIGGAIGGVLFHVIGFITGATEVMQLRKKDDRKEVTELLLNLVRPKLDSQFQQLFLRIDESVQGYQNTLHQYFDAVLDESILTLTRSAERLEQSARDSAQARAEQHDRLWVRLRQYLELDQEMTVLRARIHELAQGNGEATP